MTLADRLAAALAASLDGAPPRAGDFDDIAEEPPEPSIPAAVLVAVVDRPEPGLLLTRRTDTLRAHAGQIAFPGGRIDPSDADAVAAALREAEEEIGLPPSAVTVVGPVGRYRTVTGYDVTAVLGVIPPDLPLSAQESEVAAVFEVPFRFMLDPANRVEHEADWQGRRRRYLEIAWGPHRIWGATAAMIANLSHRIGNV